MNTETPIYNGLSIRQIILNLPKNMIKLHKIDYLKNCLFVHKNESKGFNLKYCDLVRTSNNLLIKHYNNL
jgi:hypothetical protein